MPSIESIWRYPIKGLTPERLSAVTLTPGRCLPHDRRFALARADTDFDPARPEWLPKIKFVMLMREERLAALRSRFDAGSERLVIEHEGSSLRLASTSRSHAPRSAGSSARSWGWTNRHASLRR
jgi:hypothetical protein